jgi:hypothetical protein
VQEAKSRLAISRYLTGFYLCTYEANLKGLQTHDNMLGTLLDATGYPFPVSDLFGPQFTFRPSFYRLPYLPPAFFSFT